MQRVIELPTEKTVTAMSVYDYIMMIYGPPGIGKTRFVDELTDRTYFISTDRGTRYRPALRNEVNSWGELMQVLRLLESKDISHGSYKYKIVALDHIDDIALMAEEHTCKELEIDSLGDAGYAKGYRMYKKNLWSVLQRLLKLDAGLVLIAHETIKTIKTTVETDRTMPDLTKSAWKVLLPKCDLVGYCGFKRVKIGGVVKEARTIRTMPIESIYAKDRTTRVKPEGGIELLDAKSFIKTFGGKKKELVD